MQAPIGPQPDTQQAPASRNRPVVQHHAVQRALQQRRAHASGPSTVIARNLRPAGNTYSAVKLNGDAKAHLGDVYHVNAPPTEEKKNRRKCLRSFRTTKYEQHKDVNPNRAPETCQWVIQHEQFQRWHKSPHQDLLWISADPGCGKSVLSKYLIDEWSSQNGYKNVCYFFFKDNAEQSRLETTFSAILHQLFVKQPDLIKTHAIPYWDKLGKSINQSVQAMWQILMDATSDPSMDGRTLIILDALDECSETHRKRLIDYLCQFIESTAGDTKKIQNLKFLVTSRPYDGVQRWFDKTTRTFPEIRLKGEDENEQIRHEINLVIDAHVTDLAENFMLSGMAKAKLRTTLYRMEHRTYLWLYLTIDHLHKALRDSPSPDDVRFDLLPHTVEEAYEQMLGRVTDNLRPMVQRIFRLMLAARRPLTTQEMTIALATLDGRIKDDKFFQTLHHRTRHLEERIRQWCGLFVFLNDSRLYLIHQTAKEFLLLKDPTDGQEAQRWKSCLRSIDCEAEMARFTVEYLHMQRFVVQDGSVASVSPNDSPEDSDLFKYSASWWSSHLEGGLRSPIDQALITKAAKLCTAASLSNGWFKYRYPDRSELLKRSQPSTRPDQFIAICANTLTVLKRLQTLGKLDLEAKDFRGETPLFYAIRTGNPDLLQWLTTETIKWNATSSLLSIAAEQAYMGATWLLLNKRGPLPLRVRQDTGRTALHLATQYNRPDLVKILLDTGANPNSRIRGTLTTSLMIAAKEGFEDIVKLLLERSAAINKRDASGHTALDYALINHNDSISEVLRAHGGRHALDEQRREEGDGEDEWVVVEEGEDLLDSFVKVEGSVDDEGS